MNSSRLSIQAEYTTSFATEKVRIKLRAAPDRVAICRAREHGEAGDADREHGRFPQRIALHEAVPGAAEKCAQGERGEGQRPESS
jgi:hypothetical protein